jgi:hypothetical protein
VKLSVYSAQLTVDRDAGIVRLTLLVDTSISAVMDYFEIFLTRMILCRKAAEKLGLRFALTINGQNLL